MHSEFSWVKLEKVDASAELVSSNSTARGFQARAMQGGNSNSKLSIDSKRLGTDHPLPNGTEVHWITQETSLAQY